MADIFTPWRIGSLELPNRLVRSATWEGLAEADGTPTHDLINKTAELAEGGVGLIIMGYSYVRPLGLGLPKQTGLHIDAMIGPFTRVTDAVHKMGGKVAAQVVHAGGQTRAKWIGGQPEGPSAITNPAFGEQVRELGREEIAEIVAEFARAAARAKAAEFDAVQLHGAHGYLINQFLSPNTNLRQDEYGGGIENRARFALEVYRAVRDAVGPGYPVFIKLNTDDAMEGGLQLDDALVAAKMLSDAGIDAIEVSGGVPAAGKLSPSRVVTGGDDEGYFLDNARRVKEVVNCPVAVVGGWRSKAQIEKALDVVDAVALARPFIRQPDLAHLWKTGQAEKAACISCGQCFSVGAKQGLGCGQELKEQEA